MRFTIIIALFVSSIFTSNSAMATTWDIPTYPLWVGPHLNFNFGSKQLEMSLGLEASYWFVQKDTLPIGGVCIGTEYNFQKDKFVTYTQGQLGAMFVGSSFGVVYDQEKGFGAQTSIWANLFAGAIFHYRYFNTDSTDKIIGGYAKIPAWEDSKK